MTWTPIRMMTVILVVLLLFSAPVVAANASQPDAADPSEASFVCDLIGGRTDRDSVGGGHNLAAYVNGKVFFATHDLGSVFNLLTGRVTGWWPDRVETVPRKNDPALDMATTWTGLARPAGVTETRTFLITRDDVLVVMVTLTNTTDQTVWYPVALHGDNRDSHDFRGDREIENKSTRLTPDHDAAILHDPLVGGAHLADGVFEVVTASCRPDRLTSGAPGAYEAAWRVKVPAASKTSLTIALAVATDAQQALARARCAVGSRDLVADNREQWERFFREDVPQFACSDERLMKLWYFRWYLLRFSTVDGLGAFGMPVVLEGRQAYQIYCCFSAPFMARDLKWARDPVWAEGHIAGMAHCQYDDGRFPWYVNLATNKVPLDHESRSGNSFIVRTAWEAYEVTGRRAFIERVYEPFGRNARWWRRERDRDQDGLYTIGHPLETGMDDSPRAHGTPFAGLMPLEAVDTSVYCCLDLEALARMAELLGRRDESAEWFRLADRSRQAIRSALWNAEADFFFDVSQDNQACSRVKTPVGFYPFLGAIADRRHLGVFAHLTDPDRFWLPCPVPSVSRDEPWFDATSFWKGPNWPATTCHVLDAFACAAKTHASDLKPKAAELIERAIATLFSPEIDFYERYDPLTGRPLSNFRDYMHSWWIDIVVRHVAGLVPRADDTLELNPLPPRCDWFALKGLRYHDHRIDLTWQDPDRPGPEHLPAGYTVWINGEPAANVSRPGALTVP